MQRLRQKQERKLSSHWNNLFVFPWQQISLLPLWMSITDRWSIAECLFLLPVRNWTKTGTVVETRGVTAAHILQIWSILSQRMFLYKLINTLNKWIKIFRSRKQKAQSCNISWRRNILAEQKHRFLSYRMLTRPQTGSDGGCGSNRTSEADQLWSGWWEVIRSESRNSNVKCESHRNTDTHTHTPESLQIITRLQTNTKMQRRKQKEY